ncbi:MAG: LptF/LptG family permease [Caldimicrobium sp.]
MWLFRRLLFQEFIKNFFILLVVFSAFFLVGEFFEKLPSFMGSKKPFIFFLKYLFWKMQVNFYQIFPYLLGLTSLLTLFFLSRTYELLALLSLGFFKKEITKTFAFYLIILSFTGGIMLNLILPKAFYNAQYTWDIEIESKMAQHLIFKSSLFFEGEKFILVATPLEPKAEYLADLILLYIENNEPQKVIWAKRALYLGKEVWRLEEAIFQEKERDFQPKFYNQWEGSLSIKPKTFVIVEKSVKFASFKELYQRYLFLKKIQKPYTEVLAEGLNRLIYLFIGIFLGLIPLSFYLKKYSPTKYSIAFLQSLLIFFALSTLFVAFQTLMQRFLLLAFLITFLITSGLIFFLYRRI